MSAFRDREEAGRRLGALLRGRALERPVVLGVPRGGVMVGAALAREIGGTLDVALSRKLRAPMQPELAVGAVAEDGTVFLNRFAAELDGPARAELERERAYQVQEIERRRGVYRAVRGREELAGRDVIVTDDGIATGATMIAALETARGQGAKRVIAAVPVAPTDRLSEVRSRCDEVVCVVEAREFWAIGQFYEDFRQVEDAEVVAVLRGYGGS